MCCEWGIGLSTRMNDRSDAIGSEQVPDLKAVPFFLKKSLLAR